MLSRSLLPLICVRPVPASASTSLRSTASGSSAISTMSVSHESPFTQRATSGVSALMPWPVNCTVFFTFTIDRSRFEPSAASTFFTYRTFILNAGYATNASLPCL